MLLEPCNPLRIKMEVAAEEQDDEEPQRLGMKLAVIDLEPDGDGAPIEIETHDGGVGSGQQESCARDCDCCVASLLRRVTLRFCSHVTGAAEG